MSRPPASRRFRAVALVLLGAVAAATLALVPTSAQAQTQARCRGAVARSCGFLQQITFPAPADVQLGQGSVTLTASSALAVSRVAAGRVIPDPSPVWYSSSTPAVCTISGTSAVLHSTGTCTVTAHADADLAHGVIEADPVTRSFQVLGDLALSVPNGRPLSAHQVPIGVISSGANPVTITSQSPQVCQVAAQTATLLKAGRCELAAAQDGQARVTASFTVWATPVVPAKARNTQLLTVLGQGEEHYRVTAGPGTVCRAADGVVALIDAGTCRVIVRRNGTVVRTATVDVTVPAKPVAAAKTMDLGATVYFAFNSARLTGEGRQALRKAAPQLRAADVVVVYGHTYGPGKNSRHSQQLAARRAAAVVAYLDKLGVRAKAVTKVALAMQQPVSNTPWKNRRAEIYYR